MAIGISAVKHKLQHNRLSSEKILCSVKLPALRQQTAKQIFLCFLLP